MKRVSKENIIKNCSWLLGAVVLLLAVAVWVGERFDNGSLTAYDYFPLLGLGAFSIMWTHYVLGSLRRYLGVSKSENKTYFTISSVVALVMILLHPGILIAQLYRDGFGVPPQSYLSVYPEAKLATGFGTIALIIFLLFELKKKFGKKRWWQAVEWAQVVAMALIFFHGLSLGRELSVGWYKMVWYLYGVSLVAAVFYNTWYDKRVKQGGKNGKT